MKRISRNLCGLSMALVTGLLPIAAGAQYIAPGSQLPTGAVPTRQEFEKRVDESRWNLGAVRLSPWLGLENAQLVRNMNDEADLDEEDFTLTVGAGLRAYLPTGKVFWTAHALPEYVWWQDNEDKRSFNGRLGLGLFAYFNRMALEVSQRNEQRQSFFSSEFQELTTTRTETSRLGAEVALGSRMSLFGIGERREYSNQETETPVFSLLDREEESFEIGLRYKARRWSLGLSHRDATFEFPDQARNLSNSGTSQRVEFTYDRPKLQARFDFSFRDFEGDTGSSFGQSDETTGDVSLLWSPSSRVSVLGYGRSTQHYSIDQDNSFLITDRQGLRFDFDLRRSALGLFAEVGEDAFEAVSAGAPDRIDDVVAWGINLRIELWDLLLLSIDATLTDYDSNFEGFDRETTTIGFGLQLGQVIEKLKLGGSGGDW